MIHGGNADNVEHRRQAHRRAALDSCSGPLYWEPYHDAGKEHGVWVTDDPPLRTSNAHRTTFDPTDPELRHVWRGEWRGKKYTVGMRPSKRKSVK